MSIWKEEGTCVVKIIDGKETTTTSSSWHPIGCTVSIQEVGARSMFYAISSYDLFQKKYPMPTITQILTGKGYYPDNTDDISWMHNDTQSKLNAVSSLSWSCKTKQ
jgi:hypothetical protein